VLLLALSALACLAAVLVAVALGPAAFSGDSPLDRLVLADGTVAEPVPEAEDAVPGGDRSPRPEPDGGIPVEVVLSFGVAIVAAALLARSLLRARSDETVAEEEPAQDAEVDDAAVLEAVADAARRGLDRLQGAGATGADDAVLACWVELEAAGSRLGSGRVLTDTPTDFSERLAAAVPGLDADVLADLRSTYSRVRYGAEGARPGDVGRARAALEHLLAALEPGAGRGPGR
jgi:hypothetical protein